MYMLYNSKAQTLNKACLSVPAPSLSAGCLTGLLKVEQSTDLAGIHNSCSLGNSIQCSCFAIFCVFFLKIHASRVLTIIMGKNYIQASQSRDIWCCFRLSRMGSWRWPYWRSLEKSRNGNLSKVATANQYRIKTETSQPSQTHRYHG